MVITAQNTNQKPGYKPEAGEWMDNRQNWKKICIKDICESIIDCVNKTAPAVDYQTPYKMIRTNNVKDGCIDLSDIKYVTKEVFERWTRRMLPGKGDIILTREAPLGEVGMIRTDDHIFLGQRLMQYRANPKYLDNRFLLYAFQEHTFQEQIKLLGSGATVEHMRVPDAEKLMLWLPPLPEQQAIATALSDVDALITSLDRLIAKKRDIKQATMQQLITGKTRLPGFSGELKPAHKQTEVGMIPEEWDVKKLRDLCISIVDGTHYTPRYVKDGIPFYSVENITANNFTDTKFISLKEHNELIRRCKPEKGDILLTRIGSLGYTRLVNWDVNASIYVSLALLKMNNQQILADYLYEYSKSDQFVKDVEKRSLMNATPIKINMGQIGNIPIPCPPFPEQRAIATVLSDMDAEIAALEQKRDKARALKQGMMQGLLTGKTRLL